MIRISRNPSTAEPPPQQPPIPERKKKHFAAIIIGGSLLTLNSGFINAVTLDHSGLATSHVTGTFTKSAIYLEHGDMALFAKLFFTVICFAFGSFLTSILVSYQTFHLGRAYNRVFLFGTLFLAIGCLLGQYIPGNTYYTYFITIACGMQNAMTTSYSGSVLRTTHMTGMATDVGIVFGKIVEGNYKDAWKLKLFLPMMGGYFLGGVLGSLAVHMYGEAALVVNVFLFGITGLLYTFYLAMKRHVGFFKALFNPEELLRRHHRSKQTHDETYVDIEANSQNAMSTEGHGDQARVRFGEDEVDSSSSSDEEADNDYRRKNQMVASRGDSEDTNTDDKELLWGISSSSTVEQPK